MASTNNHTITGKYDYKGDASLYCDTDSNFFSAYESLRNDPAFGDFNWEDRDAVIAFYDAIAEVANSTFPSFMAATFNTNERRSLLISAGREMVASKALFIKKKKYAMLYYDKDGFRFDQNGKPGKLKAMGLDLKRADTPKFMQKFLESLLMDILTGESQGKMFDDIKTFRRAFKTRPGWEKGSPKKVSGYTEKEEKVAQSMKVDINQRLNGRRKFTEDIPGHVRASINWNTLCEINNDRYSQRITDGTRIVVCKLKPSSLMMTSVAFPIDEFHLPPWFRDLPFDDSAMETTIIDQKLENLVGVLKWDLSKTKEYAGEEFFVFE